MMIDFWGDLNPAQQEVVTDVDHPILVLAGAGAENPEHHLPRCLPDPRKEGSAMETAHCNLHQ
jgi:hypothetical protein